MVIAPNAAAPLYKCIRSAVASLFLFVFSLVLPAKGRIDHGPCEREPGPAPVGTWRAPTPLFQPLVRECVQCTARRYRRRIHLPTLLISRSGRGWTLNYFARRRQFLFHNTKVSPISQFITAINVRISRGFFYRSYWFVCLSPDLYAAIN